MWGSRELIRIFNRLGVVCSVDSHDRFVTEEAEKERQLCMWDHLDHYTFTVASTDNLDILQSHAAVYCENQSRSFYGTTTQVIQPNPRIKLDPKNDCEPSQFMSGQEPPQPMSGQEPLYPRAAKSPPYPRGAKSPPYL